MDTLDAASLIRDARRRAGLSQRELARRSGTAQSVVARIERGQTDPSTRTLARLVSAAGFELEAKLRATLVADTHMLDDIARILTLTPEQRLLEVRNVSRFLSAARRV
jgi:transcriptional regulator with XRE-family HTH domain